MFQKDAFGADWSKTHDLLAYNAKGSDGRFHIYTVKPDGQNPRQFGVGGTNFPQRTTGTPVWSPSGKFIAFVAEKSDHPGNSVPLPAMPSTKPAAFPPIPRAGVHQQLRNP